MKKIGGTTSPGGRVSRQSQRLRGVDATFSVFRKQKIRHFEKMSAYYDAETYRTCWNYHFPFV